MSRRDDINQHHTIRRTFAKPPRRRISTMLLIMLIVSTSMGVGVLSSNSAKPSGSTLPAPTREQLFTVASMVADGQWGAELMDSCQLISNGFTAIKDIDAAQYATMLAEGSKPSKASDKLIAALATDEAQAEVYRLALDLSYQNRLNLQKE